MELRVEINEECPGPNFNELCGPDAFIDKGAVAQPEIA
jgi:hypothetical protein